MPKTTIKEVLEDVANFYSNREFTLDGEDYKGVDTALAEIRQLLKEAEPTHAHSEKEHIEQVRAMLGDKVGESDEYSKGYYRGFSDGITDYTANIEKRLG